jgi:hypothetical protein
MLVLLYDHSPLLKERAGRIRPKIAHVPWYRALLGLVDGVESDGGAVPVFCQVDRDGRVA